MPRRSSLRKRNWRGCSPGPTGSRCWGSRRGLNHSPRTQPKIPMTTSINGCVGRIQGRAWALYSQYNHSLQLVFFFFTLEKWGRRWNSQFSSMVTILRKYVWTISVLHYQVKVIQCLPQHHTGWHRLDWVYLLGSHSVRGLLSVTWYGSSKYCNSFPGIRKRSYSFHQKSSIGMWPNPASYHQLTIRAGDCGRTEFWHSAS